MRNDLIYRAIRLARQGRKDEARAVLKRVLAVDPRNELAWMWYVDCLSSNQERIRALEECLMRLPGRPGARRVLALLRDNWADPRAEEDPAATGDHLYAPGAASEVWTTGVAPFTVPPEDVTHVEVEIAEHRVWSSRSSRPFEAVMVPATEATQPVRVQAPVPPPPDDEELLALSEPGAAAPETVPDPWTPIFSDEVPGRRSAWTNVRIQPRSRWLSSSECLPPLRAPRPLSKRQGPPRPAADRPVLDRPVLDRPVPDRPLPQPARSSLPFVIPLGPPAPVEPEIHEERQDLAPEEAVALTDAPTTPVRVRRSAAGAVPLFLGQLKRWVSNLIRL